MPPFGDPDARIVVLGLAPAAHGGNRTGRIFTGDRSGDWLFAALWRAGLANQPESVSRDDGLRLRDCWVTAAVRCAPPANRPTPAERDDLPADWLERELALLAARAGDRLPRRLCLGCGSAAAAPAPRPWPRVRPRRGARELGTAGRVLLGCYHVSQQNTFTGRLTEPMLDAIFARAQVIAARRRGATLE